MRKINAIIWLSLKVSVLKAMSEKAAKTTSVITSWIIFNCSKENGPPLPRKPILLAGTWKKYSNNAMPQLISTMEISPNLLNHFHSANFRWPYQASVINVFDNTKSTMVKTPFIVEFFLINRNSQNNHCNQN